MFRILVTVSALLVASTASGQWLEATIPAEGEPWAIAYNPASCKVYCTLRGNDSLMVIDGASNAVVAGFKVRGRGPAALCANPTYNKVYCASGGITSLDSTIDVIDGQGDSIVRTMFADRGVVAMVYGPVNNRLYAANYEYRTVSIFDGEDDELVNTVVVDGNPRDLAYGEAYNEVYVPNCGNEWTRLAVIDGTTNLLDTMIDVGQRNSAVCCNTAGTKAYVSHYYHGAVSVVDLFGDSVLARVPVGLQPEWLCYNTRREKLYVSTYVSNEVGVICGRGDTLICRIPVGAGPSRLLYNHLNDRVYCANSDDASVSIIDGLSDLLVGSITVDSGPLHLALNPVHNRVYVTNRLGETISVIRDTVPAGVSEAGEHDPAGRAPCVFVKQVLTLEGPHRACLVDVAGTRVASLGHGPNDIRHLSPGVYFLVSEQSPCPQKVIVTK